MYDYIFTIIFDTTEKYNDERVLYGVCNVYTFHFEVRLSYKTSI